jgi:serine/threonine protein kinase
VGEQVIGGRYRLERLLGRGGMSEVWLATDTDLERQVAIKLLAPDADHERFEREARAAASLAHPNINQLYDFGESDRRPYMVLEYLPGGTLDDRLRRGRPLPDAETEQIARDLANGLAHAHARGLVHRDLKPANVLFDAEGRAKIADFGIARMGDAGTLTDAGTVLGTAAFISPEQALGEPATPASDVYSFGVILYRMLTGRLPFESEHPMELVAMHRDASPPRVESVRPDAPAHLESLATTALAKSPADRPSDGEALAAELRADELVTPTQVLPAASRRRRPTAAPAGAWRDRRPLAAIVLALAVLALAGVGLAVLTHGSSSSPTARTKTGKQTSRRSTAASTSATAHVASATTTGTTPSTRATHTRPTTSRSLPSTTASTTSTATLTPTTVETTTPVAPTTTAPLTTPTTP